MIPIALVLALLFPIPPQAEGSSNTTDSAQQQIMEQAKAAREKARQAGIRVNDLALHVHSEADARAFVDAVAEEVGGGTSLGWATASMRHRVAHAEFQSVNDPAHLIPEQRIVNVWNEYVREINAPEESLVTAPEIHNLRDAMVVVDRRVWEQLQLQTMWTAPGIYAIKPDGSMADGCRAVEALKILHNLFREPAMLQGARQRVKEGVLASDRFKEMQESKQHQIQHPVALLRARPANSNPALLAEVQYVRDHGPVDYQRMMMRLFEEMFPTE